MWPLLEQLEAVRQRLSRQVGVRSRDLDERELEREPRVAALPQVVDRDCEQVDQAHDGGLRQLVGLLAKALAGLRCHGKRLGHVAEVLDEQQVAQVLEQVDDEPARRSWPCSASSSTNVSAPAVSRSTIASQRRNSVSSSTAPTSCSTSCTETCVLRCRRKLVERGDCVAERAARAARDQRERGIGGLDPLAVADATEEGDELLQPRTLEDERLAARAHRLQHLGQIGGAEDEDEVGRRLLDQLQQRVPGCVGELVRLVEDVDLEAALDRLEHDALADLADVVDAALRGGIHLDHVERRAARRSRHTRCTGCRGLSSARGRS